MGYKMGTIGIEWVNKYHGRGKDLKNNDNNAQGFYNTLQGVRQFEYGNDLAWDQDFEESGVGAPSAGTDTIFADNVDIVYFSGHGGPSGPSFGISDKDSGRARHSEMRLGNRQCEWIVFDACKVLNRYGWTNWIHVFKGLHGILGFETTCTDVDDRGKKFAQRLNQGEKITRAWVKACEETEGSNKRWAHCFAGRGNWNTLNDHWWGKGYVSVDPTNPDRWRLTHGPC